MTDKIARTLFTFIGVVGIGFGLLYLFRESLMPFHAAFIARTGAIHSENAERLLLMMMHVVGALFLAVSVTILVLVWTCWTVPAARYLVSVLSLAALTPIQVASWKVGNRMGVIETVLVLAVVAVILCVVGGGSRVSGAPGAGGVRP